MNIGGARNRVRERLTQTNDLDSPRQSLKGTSFATFHALHEIKSNPCAQENKVRVKNVSSRSFVRRILRCTEGMNRRRL